MSDPTQVEAGPAQVEPGPAQVEAGPTQVEPGPAADPPRGPGTLARILDSLGFRFGLLLLTLGFAVGAVVSWELLPAGPLDAAATIFFALTLTPAASILWMAVGVLAPPAPFRSGLLLGLLSSVLMTILLVALGTDTGESRLAQTLGYSVVMIIAASLMVGIVGWIVRRVFMPPAARRPFREQSTLEPRSRPWPPVVIALAYVSLPLIAFATESTEWLFAAAFGSVITVAMISGGLDVQRRYPERRTPVIVVGLVAGVIAGLAMLQAIWTESRWPQRRASSDRLAIGVSVALVILVAYGTTGDGGFGTLDTPWDGREYVVRPAAGQLASEAEVELTRDLLEAPLETLAIEARVRADDDGRIDVRVPVDTDGALVQRVLTAVGLLEFVPVPSSCISQVVADASAPPCLAEAEPLFDGDAVTTARLGQDQTTGEIIVDLKFDDTGSRIFDEHAQEHLGEYFAIVLDGIVKSAPSINATRFGGRAQISGAFTIEEAAALVAALKAGRTLPYQTVVSTADS